MHQRSQPLNKSLFDIEMTKAEVMGGVERPAYWTGYQKGLNRRFHGNAFCTREQHEQWMAEALATEEDRKEHGQGYRDGYLGIVDLDDPANGIQILRKWRGWSVEDLAEKVGVEPATVKDWEHGHIPSEDQRRILDQLRSE
jgi:DNA-binding transcriptional regulator YiaG